MNSSISLCKIEVYRDISYTRALEIQKEHLLRLRHNPEAQEVIMFCEHMPVITLGRSGDGSFLLSSVEDIQNAGVEFLKVPRGGDITYHGTGQWTVYPILRLDKFCKDLHRYMRLLEEGVIQTLKGYGLTGGRREGLTGVWVGREKICAVGVAVSRWISWHGFAFNVQPDLELFKRHIVPCGIAASEGGVTSLNRLTGREYPMLEVVPVLLEGLFAVMPYFYTEIDEVGI